MRKDRYDFLKEHIHILNIDLNEGVIKNRNINSVDGKGYLIVRVSGKMFKVHEVVAFAGGLDIINKTINHKDTNKLNNKLNNLEAVSNLENMRHAFANGIFNGRKIAVGEEQGSAKLTEKQVKEIMYRIKNGERNTEIAVDYKVAPQTISKIRCKSRWKHVTV